MPADRPGRTFSAITMLRHYKLGKEPLDTTRDQLTNAGTRLRRKQIGKEWLAEGLITNQLLRCAWGPPGIEKWKDFLHDATRRRVWLARDGLNDKRERRVSAASAASVDMMQNRTNLRGRWPGRLKAAKAKVVLCQARFLTKEDDAGPETNWFTRPIDTVPFWYVSSFLLQYWEKVWSVGAAEDKRIAPTRSPVASRHSLRMDGGAYLLRKRCHAARSRQRAVSKIPVALVFVVGAPAAGENETTTVHEGRLRLGVAPLPWMDATVFDGL
ncbi:hypothetical protein B0H16DRAFT_1469235 [Mycena metata]|uniref:Uncharacterized protein n=1 Tax=Mycena metata TaxID=1033252 RepID=A0AAD7I039_9AGAR|nr:hypothetical protein B0H16DRAFT_1469235 [Mycena metata]